MVTSEGFKRVNELVKFIKQTETIFNILLMKQRNSETEYPIQPVVF